MVVAFLKFGVTPLDGFRENGFYGRTSDVWVVTVALLSSSTKTLS